MRNITQSACQVASYFPSLVPFQMMKCVNILERNINCRHPERSLLSRGAICWVANESFRAKTAPRGLNARAVRASYISKMNTQSAINHVKTSALGRGMFGTKHRELNHTAVCGRQRHILAVVNSVVWFYQRHFMLVCRDLTCEDHWRYESGIRFYANFPKT